MRIVIVILLLVAAHFSLSAFVPGPEGRATFYWPWATDSHLIIGGLSGTPAQGGSLVMMALAGIAGLCLLGATAALMSVLVPAGWWVPLVGVGAAASIALFMLYLGPLSIIPIAIDVFLLWGVFIQQWTVSALNGG